MIHLPASVRVYLCLRPRDMRKSFDSLQALVREHLELDAFAGHLFVFMSRRKDRVKILYWDRDGFAVWSKRLSGTPELRPRWQRAVDFTSYALGDPAGKLYVDHYFPAATKAEVQAMIADLISAFRQRIDGLTSLGNFHSVGTGNIIRT